MVRCRTVREGQIFIMDPNPTDIQVGAKLRVRRIKLGLSDEKLARALGVSLQQLIAWELGVTRIGPPWLVKIGQLLEVDSGYFFKNSEPARSSSYN
jgi:transcriptional regulator with XRE-family HTH domain